MSDALPPIEDASPPPPPPAPPAGIAPPRPRPALLELLLAAALKIFGLLVAGGFWGVVMVIRLRILHPGEHLRPAAGPISMAFFALADWSLDLSLAWWLAARRLGRAFAAALRITRPTREQVRLAAVLGAACLLFEIVLVSVAGKNNEPDVLTRLTSTPSGFAFFATLGLFSPIVEEIYYRGFWFLCLENRFDARVATWVVATWFVLLHVPQLWPSLAGVMAIAALSAVTTTLRARTGSVVPGMIAHAVYNWGLLALALVALAAQHVMPAR